MTGSPHRLVNPDTLAPAVGYSHAVVAAPGRTVYLGGQIASDLEGVCRGGTLVEQFDLALENVARALDATGASPEHLVSLHVFVTEGDAYRAALPELGDRYVGRLGRHYPAISFFEVMGLFDPAALVELIGIAVVP
jgi:enamine deaminase RidA (YjgF/YER057c/UK114 family)